MESTSTAASTALLLELVAALGGSYAFYKLVGPFIYNECFAAADDDEVRMLEAGLFPPTERSPLLANGASPRPNSIRLAMQMYNAHIAQSSSAGSTPAATQSGLSTPVSASPSTPVSAASSYFDLRQPPLYVKDVTTALEKEAKRRTSSEFMAANFSAGFGMSTPSDGTRTPGFRSIAGSSRPTTPAMRPTLTMTRRFSNPGAPRSKPFSEDTSYLTAALICLLHTPDLNDFFLSGKYLEDAVEDKHHQAIINAFAATTQFFWPPTNGPLYTTNTRKAVAATSTPLDLTVFQSLFKKTPSVSSAATPLSSSPTSRPSTPPLACSPLSSPSTLVNLSASSTTLTGAQTISQLLRSLHVALNEGEYTSDQPTYLREPFRLGRDRSSSHHSHDDEQGLRAHVGFLRNMKDIQEDSIVRDLFEGLCCVKVRCGECDETTVNFESFNVLSLPPSARTQGTLVGLLREFERPTAPKMSWCSRCRSYQGHTDTRKIWSLPEILVLQLSPSSASPSTMSTAPSSGRTTPSPPMRRMSFSTTTSSVNTTSATEVAYPIASLNMAKYNGEERHRRSSSAQVSESEYDLSSESGSESEEEVDEEMYDLFAVRECVRGGGGVLKYRSIAKDPSDGEGWTAFDAATGVGREVRDLREVSTPHADMLFYRRR